MSSPRFRPPSDPQPSWPADAHAVPPGTIPNVIIIRLLESALDPVRPETSDRYPTLPAARENTGACPPPFNRLTNSSPDFGRDAPRLPFRGETSRPVSNGWPSQPHGPSAP